MGKKKKKKAQKELSQQERAKLLWADKERRELDKLMNADVQCRCGHLKKHHEPPKSESQIVTFWRIALISCYASYYDSSSQQCDCPAFLDASIELDLKEFSNG